MMEMEGGKALLGITLHLTSGLGVFIGISLL
jgi:hypothetical protein